MRNVAWQRRWLQQFSVVVGAVGLLAAFVASSHAAPPWPAGWEVKPFNGGIIAISPQSPPAAGVHIFSHAAQRSTQPLRPWFDAQIESLGSNGMKVQRRNGTSMEGSLAKDVFNAVAANGETSRVFAFAYPTPQGHQLMLMFAPLDMSVDEPRIQAGLDTIARVWRSGAPAQLAGTGGRTNAAPKVDARPGAAPAQAKSSSTAQSANKGGARCREELRTITTSQLQRVCFPSAGGMSNCTMQAVPVQQQVLQEVCY